MFNHSYKILVAFRFKYPKEFSRDSFSSAVSFLDQVFGLTLAFFFSVFYLGKTACLKNSNYIVGKFCKRYFNEILNLIVSLPNCSDIISPYQKITSKVFPLVSPILMNL